MVNKPCMEVEINQPKRSEDNTIKSIRNLFRIRKENEAIEDIRILFEQEEDYHKRLRAGNFWNNNYVEYKTVIEAKAYQEKNTFGKSNLTSRM